MANPTKSIILTATMSVVGEVIAGRFVSAKRKQATGDDVVLGVALHDAKPNEVLGVDVLGIGIVESGGAIEQGDKVGSDAQGCAIKSETGQFIALSSASGANEPVKVLLR